MIVALQMVALAALMVALGLVVRWGQLRLRGSYLAGRVAASLAGIVLLPLMLPLLGARTMNDLRAYAMGGVFGYAGFWLAVKLWPSITRTGRRRP
jgi:hypothetical protein